MKLIIKLERVKKKGTAISNREADSSRIRKMFGAASEIPTVSEYSNDIVGNHEI